MKIALAQIQSYKGDIPANLTAHNHFLDMASTHGVEVIVFPELSITGYEPELANELATTQEDSRFNVFQDFSNVSQVTIGAGMPIETAKGIQIGMILFQPHQPRQTYAKQYLHADELPYFIPGDQQLYLTAGDTKMGLAICYELSVPHHAENVHNNGANIYLASVAKTIPGVEKAIATMAQTAAKYAMPALMVNCVGSCEGLTAGGRSSVWNDQGQLIGQLDAKREGLLIFDTLTQEVLTVYK
jgi:predicted amidohydrolase